MKKIFTVFIFALVVALSAAVLTGCQFDSDYYGFFLNAEKTRSIDLKSDNAAVLGDGVNDRMYYADYHLFGEQKIELREKDFWGDVKYTIKIISVDELVLVETSEYVPNPDKPYETETKTNEMTFMRAD